MKTKTKAARGLHIKVDSCDVQYLCNTKHKCFLADQPDRFATIKGHPTPGTNGQLMWCGRDYLPALITWQWLQVQGHRAAILVDECDDEFCGGDFVVWTDKEWELN